MKVGIVGMPNAGKSSLFNALTQAGAEAANYPFTTIEPNVAVVPVRDERLDRVAETIGASSIVYDTIDFHDIAGLVRGAHEGEGLGNQFLANIRETDAIVHVVRAHEDANVVHPEGSVDPMRDIETIETELIYADLEQAERRHGRVVRDARGRATRRRSPRRRGCARSSRRCRRAARRAPCRRPPRRADALRDLSAAHRPSRCCSSRTSTRAPSEVPAAVAAHAAAQGALVVAVSSSPGGRAVRARRRGGGRRCARSSARASPSLDRGRRAARSRCSTSSRSSPPARRSPRSRGTCKRGLTAWHAAGEIHTRHPEGLRPRRGHRRGTRWSRPAATPARARRARCGSRAATTSMPDGDVITVRFTP